MHIDDRDGRRPEPVGLGGVSQAKSIGGRHHGVSGFGQAGDGMPIGNGQLVARAVSLVSAWAGIGASPRPAARTSPM